MNMTNKWLKQIVAIIPIIFSSISFILVCFLLTQVNSVPNVKKDVADQEREDIFEKVQIFPKLNKYDFYDDIKIADGKAIIDDDMVAKIINYIINNSQIPYGAIQYNFTRSTTELILTFAWDASNHERIGKIYKKTYKFNLQK